METGRAPRVQRTRSPRWVAGAIIAATALTACTGSAGTGAGDLSAATADEDDRQGGRIVYGLLAETSDGWCLPESVLAAGTIVARSMYDTLTAPDADGEYVPYLAASVEPDQTFTEWEVVLRDGVTFHDGSDLTADVVKNNLDAYRGVYEGREAPLWSFVLAGIADVTVEGPLTLRITTVEPWPALPAYLYLTGRMGIMAQTQLDDPSNCSSQPVGTGPFVFDEWRVNDRLVVVRNDGYWQVDQDGVSLPYLDEIEFRPIPEGSQRLNGLEGGELDAFHTEDPLLITELAAMEERGAASLVSAEKFGEVTYTVLNVARAPFDNRLAREAFAYAVDNEELNEIRNGGLPTLAEGPFVPGNIGHLADSGFPPPARDVDRARSLVEQYEAETGEPLEFTYSTLGDPAYLATAQLIANQLGDAGIEVTLRVTDEASEMNELLAGEFQATRADNHPGGDPDENYIWWHSESPINFGRIADPEVDRLLDEGRHTADAAARRGIYEDLNRLFAEELYNIWHWYRIWAIGTVPELQGVLGPQLPDGSEPFPGLAGGHPTVGLWLKR